MPDETSSKKGSRKSSPKTSKMKKVRKSVENAIVHLPVIESYQKEVIFTAEGTGRVVAKIERLMGSDKIHYFDREWMGEFAQVLDIDDARDLVEKSKMRANNERERSKKLALNMEMVPTPDMADIKEHPLYKVNFIMKKLEKMDLSAVLTSTKTKLPRIVQTEPFCEDFSGKIFENYPGHRKYDGGTEATLLYKNAETIPSADAFSETGILTVETKPSEQIPSEEEEEEGDEAEMKATKSTKSANSTKSTAEKVAEGEDNEEEEGEENEEVAAIEAQVRESLAKLMKDYNIETEDNLFALYAPYRSEVVEELYVDENGVNEMYGMGKDINELYAREAMKTEKELKALYRNIAHM